MITFNNTKVYNFMGSIRNMRNSWQSWGKMDSYEGILYGLEAVTPEQVHPANIEQFYLGPEDKKLATKLLKAGPDHAKYVRQIFISTDITAPLYFFKQFDQYKISVCTNSTSTMHTITKQPFSIDMFSVEDLNEMGHEMFLNYLNDLETIRNLFLETKDKRYWRMLIQMLPDSINQIRGTTMNYQVLQNIYHSRKHHRLSEWHDFCTWIESLPYSFLITKEIEK